MTGRVSTGRLLEEYAFTRIGDQGPPLVILPGLTLDNAPTGRLTALGYAAAFHRLARSRQVWIVQRPRGLAPASSFSSIAAGYADVIAETWGRVDVVGMSTGGLIAQHLALDAPQRVRRLALVVSGGRLAAPGRAICESWLALAEAGDWLNLRRSQAACAVDGRVASALARVATTGRAASAAPDARDKADFHVLVAAALQHDLHARLTGVTVPTLVVGGSEDPFFPEAELTATAAAIPGASLEVHEGSGHGVPKHHGRRLQHQLDAFLARTTHPTSSTHPTHPLPRSTS